MARPSPPLCPPDATPSRATGAPRSVPRTGQDSRPDDLGQEGETPSNKRNTTGAGEPQDRGP